MKREQCASVAIGPAVLGAFDAILDVRSPAEYALDHVPGAISCPVLDDAERARIGTVHAQVSAFEAKKRGAALVARNIARHVETAFADEPPQWRPLVYCWRGGKRSAAMVHVLREIGWDAVALEGGYRAYRRFVVAELARLAPRLRYRVVHGATGCGKSRLLKALARAGAQVLDLEELAAHRGSVLGDLPSRSQPSQKLFESLLRQTLAALDPALPVYVEGESKKIGQLQVPDALMHAMRASSCVRLEASLPTRAALLLDEYHHFLEDPAALGAQLDCLAALHGQERIVTWKALAARGAWAELVARLLEEHYDPAYQRSATRNFPRLAQAPLFSLEGPDPGAFARLARELVSGRDEAHTETRLTA
jgi:tRNA 2-selenouridine synthase